MKEDSFAIGIIEIPQDEYINKTWLVQKLNEAVTEIKEKAPDQPDYAAIVETLAQTINKIQPADVVEVRHAKWVSLTPPLLLEEFRAMEADTFFMCSECKGECQLVEQDDYYDYCPRCGCKMDKEE